jgi:hypothetical protein
VLYRIDEHINRHASSFCLALVYLLGQFSLFFGWISLLAKVKDKWHKSLAIDCFTRNFVFELVQLVELRNKPFLVRL